MKFSSLFNSVGVLPLIGAICPRDHSSEMEDLTVLMSMAKSLALAPHPPHALSVGLQHGRNPKGLKFLHMATTFSLIIKTKPLRLCQSHFSWVFTHSVDRRCGRAVAWVQAEPGLHHRDNAWGPLRSVLTQGLLRHTPQMRDCRRNWNLATLGRRMLCKF